MKVGFTLSGTLDLKHTSLEELRDEILDSLSKRFQEDDLKEHLDSLLVEYDVINEDLTGICSICKDSVSEKDFRDHLTAHNPNFNTVPYQAVLNAFDTQD